MDINSIKMLIYSWGLMIIMRILHYRCTLPARPPIVNRIFYIPELEVAISLPENKLYTKGKVLEEAQVIARGETPEIGGLVWDYIENFDFPKSEIEKMIKHDQMRNEYFQRFAGDVYNLTVEVAKLIGEIDDKKFGKPVLEHRTRSVS